MGVVWLVVRVRRHDRDRTRALLWSAAGTVGALVAVWAAPLWDEWRGTGNLSTLVRWFRDNNEPVHTIAEGARIVGGQFAIVPDWVTGTRRIAFDGSITLVHTTLVPLLLIPVVVAAVVAFRRRDRVARSLLVMLGVTVVAAVVSVAADERHDVRVPAAVDVDARRTGDRGRGVRAVAGEPRPPAGHGTGRS